MGKCRDATPLERIEGALSDLWADAQERPKIRGAIARAHALYLKHCGEEEAGDFLENMRLWDVANKAGNIEGENGLVELTEDLGNQYKLLKEAILG